MNSEKKDLPFAYVLSAARDSALWREVEFGLPARGPDCPLTADLIHYVLGFAAPWIVKEVETHVASCEACQVRVVAQQQAIERAAAGGVSPATGETTLEQMTSHLKTQRDALRKPRKPVDVLWKGSLIFLDRPIDQAASEFSEDLIDCKALLAPMRGRAGVGALNARLLWSRDSKQGLPWQLQLSLATHESDQEFGNSAEELADLGGRHVRLTLFSEKQAVRRLVDTKLTWDSEHRKLVTDLKPVPGGDPKTVEMLKLAPGDRVQEPNVD